LKTKPTDHGVRASGIEVIGDVPWGTHFCQFYKTKQDLIDILVPYFKAGLDDNEFCMWITSTPLTAEEARQSLRKVVRNLDDLVQKGQIEILDYSQWYTRSGKFDSDQVLNGWVEKERQALEKGFHGLRLTGNTFWLERNGWKAFTEYEAQVNGVIGQHKMIALCTYSLDKCDASEIIDVLTNHQFALVRREGKWDVFQSSERERIGNLLERSEKKFSVLYSSMMEGVAFHNLVYDSSGKAIDYVITDATPVMRKLLVCVETRRWARKLLNSTAQESRLT